MKANAAPSMLNVDKPISAILAPVGLIVLAGDCPGESVFTTWIFIGSIWIAIGPVIQVQLTVDNPQIGQVVFTVQVQLIVGNPQTGQIVFTLQVQLPVGNPQIEQVESTTHVQLVVDPQIGQGLWS